MSLHTLRKIKIYNINYSTLPNYSITQDFSLAFEDN